jgi:hypothetical protein
MIANVLMCQCLIMLVDLAIHFRYVFPYVHTQQCRLLVLPHVTMPPTSHTPDLYTNTRGVHARIVVRTQLNAEHAIAYLHGCFRLLPTLPFFSYAWSASQDMSRIGRYFEGAIYLDTSCEVSLASTHMDHTHSLSLPFSSHTRTFVYPLSRPRTHVLFLGEESPTAG